MATLPSAEGDLVLTQTTPVRPRHGRAQTDTMATASLLRGPRQFLGQQISPSAKQPKAQRDTTTHRLREATNCQSLRYPTKSLPFSISRRSGSRDQCPQGWLLCQLGAGQPWTTCLSILTKAIQVDVPVCCSAEPGTVPQVVRRSGASLHTCLPLRPAMGLWTSSHSFLFLPAEPMPVGGLSQPLLVLGALHT